LAGDTNIVKGKKFMVCCTTGSPKEAYQHGGKNKYTIEEYVRPYEGQCNTIFFTKRKILIKKKRFKSKKIGYEI